MQPAARAMQTSLRGVSTSLHDVLCDDHEPTKVAIQHQASPDSASPVRSFTYGELGSRSRRLALGMKEAGVKKGDIVAVMLPKGPAVAEVAVALARIGAVYQPLFTAFEWDGIDARIGNQSGSGSNVVITDGQNRHKFGHGDSGTDRIIFVTEQGNGPTCTGDHDYDDIAANGGLLADQDHEGLCLQAKP